MTETLFYVFGLGLMALALIVSFIGLRSKAFPSKTLGRATVAIFAVVVVGTAVTAVSLAEEEQEHREDEQAEAKLAELEPGVETGESQDAQGEPAGGQEAPEADETEPAPGAGSTLALGADPEGALAFDTEQLTAQAGKLEIDFSNPSDVPHNVVIEGEGDEILGETPQITDDRVTLTVAEIEPGEYTFFCSVLGHRESGMEGTLTVE
jgi:plastocyanin